MANVSPASSFGAFSGARGRRPRAKRLSRAMVDLLEPRRLLAPWITTESTGVGGGAGDSDPLSGGSGDVEVVDGKAYFLMGGLTILDVSGAGTPVQLCRMPLPVLNTHGVTVAGSYAYVWGSGSTSDLAIIDISNPAIPVVAGSYAATAARICVADAYAYFTDSTGLHIIDVSNPSAVTPIGSLALSNPGAVTVAGSYAYLAGGRELAVVDIADPVNPVKVGSCNLLSTAAEVVVAGSTAYAASSLGLEIIDVSNPAAPVELTLLATAYPARDLRVSDSKVYLVEGPSGMDIIDVSDPLHPSTLSQLDTPGSALQVALWGTTVYVGDGKEGLQVINAADPQRPVKVSMYDPPEVSTCIAFSGTTAYVDDVYQRKLDIIDVSDFDVPTWVDWRRTNTAINDLAISGSYLYATENTGLEIFNISTPSNPIWVCLYDVRTPGLPEEPGGIAISGSYAYIACDQIAGGGPGSLRVVDIANPAVPVLVGSYAISGGAWDVAVSGTLAYVGALTFGLRIIDISDPAHMVQVGSLATSNKGGPILLAGSRVYLGSSIIDVSNPAAPMLLNGSVPGGVLAVSGDLAYTDKEIVNVSDPAALVSVGRYTGNKANAIALYDDSSALFAEIAMSTVRFITGENEPATDISLSQSSVAENLPTGTVVGTLSSTCLNPANTFTYSKAGGTGSTDNSRFTISGNQLKTNASFNYEVKNSYSIRIRSTDAVGQWFDKAFTIGVTDVNERPTNISLSGSSVVENQPVGTVVGMLSSTDPDAGNTFTYSLVSGTGDVDNASFTISGSELLTAASFDYHTKSSYSILVRSTDQGGLFREKSFTITVTEDTSAPTVTAVYVRGSTWNASYLSFLAANTPGSSTTYGYAIPAGSGSTQLETLPWRNLNRISIAFSEDVSVAQAQFAIAGSVGSYSVSGFSYSLADHVATWSLSAAIGPDKLYMAVPGSGSSAVKDAAGNVLDGEWLNPTSYGQVGSTDTFPSGNGSAGGDFAFRFDVLPGDSSGGSLGKVNVADALQTKGRSGLPVSLSTYRSDFDGNNLVNVSDVLYVKNKSSVYSLPVNPPVVPVFGAAMSQVSLLQGNRFLTLW